MARYWTNGADGADEVRVFVESDETVVLCQMNEATGREERVVAFGSLGRLLADWISRAEGPSVAMAA